MINFDKELQTFYLESKDISYVFRINPHGFLEHLYYGARIGRDDLSYGIYKEGFGHGTTIAGCVDREQSLNVFKNEYPTFGRSDYKECAFAFDSDGVRVGDFKYQSHEILNAKPKISGMPSLRGGETLAVELSDDFNGIKLTLYYGVYDEYSVITRWAVIENTGKKPLYIDRAYSVCLDLPDKDYETLTLYGSWAMERSIEITPVVHGILDFDSKRGVSSSELNPFIAVKRPDTNEDDGEVFGVNLIYSGDFAIKVQAYEDEQTRVLCGINDFGFKYKLNVGDKFSTPEAVTVYSRHGLGNMSRTFHDVYRDLLINKKFSKSHRPIVINNWEATYFNFNNEKLEKIIDSVKDTGIDTFVLDDGWFGSRVSSDLAGLGDWYVNKDKIDLKRLIDYVHFNGLKFGLWFEPEMVNADSDLYRSHPDYIIAVPDLTPCEGRSQLVLDVTRKDVRDYIVNSVSAILDEYDIDYVKWDMNRSLTDFYSRELKENSRELCHRYVLGLYDLCERIVNGHPDIIFEGCASGGCRFDAGMLYYFPQIWTSDCTDAYERTKIQYGTSMVYPLSSMSCHVSAVPNHQTGRITPYKTRATVAHLGATGYELDTTKLPPEELAEIKRQVDDYKAIEDLVLCGDLYRLKNPFNGNCFAEEIVSKDGTHAHIAIALGTAKARLLPSRVYPKGLLEDAVYEIVETGEKLKGSTVMNYGLKITVNRDYDSMTYTIKTVK